MPVKRKRRFPWGLLLLLIGAGGAAAGWYFTRGTDTIPAAVPPVDAAEDVTDTADVQNEGEDSLDAIVAPVLPIDEEEEEEPAEESSGALEPSEEPANDLAVTPVDDLEEDTEPAEEPETFSYEIDTIASNLDRIRSMVMTDTNTVYYTDGTTVYNSKNSQTLEVGGEAGAYLVHNSYDDTVYLIEDTFRATKPAIYNITGFEEANTSKEDLLVLDEESCPALADISIVGRPPSNKIDQIGVLKNGALLVPCYSGTGMVNIRQKTVTPTLHMYGNDVSVVIDDSVVFCRGGYAEATIAAFDGTSTEITFEREIPDVPLYSRNGAIYCYDSTIGVCCYNLDGSVTTLIPKESIRVKDYQSLIDTDIWGIAVGTSDCIALYDRTLNCIRLIRPITPE